MEDKMRHALFANEQVLLKLKQYCAYQERCITDVRAKLYSLTVTDQDADNIIAKLTAENYLDEERFAVLFAGGKFRLKQWGRVKIKYALREKKVSDTFARNALSQIDENEYLQTLNRLAEKKLATLRNEKNSVFKRKKLGDYLLQKGFEPALVNKVTRVKIQ